MTGRMDKTHPVIQKEIRAQVDDAMWSRGIDLEDPVRAELLSRADVDFGFRGQPLVRFRAPDATFLPAAACLDVLLNETEHTTSTPTGPKRIPYTDREALFHVDVEKIAKGEILVFDDRKHPR